MKTLFTLFIIPILLLHTTTQKENFVGKWIGEDQNEIGYLIFDNEGFASFEIDGKTIGGKTFFMNGQKGQMTYSINHNTSPIEIDFTITKTLTGESNKILGIAEFIDKNTINFEMSFDNKRPSKFGEHSIVLKRVQ